MSGNRLGRADQLAVQGKTEPARVLLKEEIAAGRTDGVTDAALFRLALLSLKGDLEAEGVTQAIRLLEQLKKEYPRSHWTAESAALLDLLTKSRKQLKGLRENNAELKRTVDSLKRIDVEMERKGRQR